jgi:hypothetical protein
MDILETVRSHDYDPKSRDYVLDFSKNIYWLDDDRISQEVKEAYKMPLEYVSLETLAQELKMQQGIALGLEKGEKKGAAKAKAEVALNLLGMGLPIEQVSKGTGFSLEELNKLASEKLNDNPGLDGVSLTIPQETDRPRMDRGEVRAYAQKLLGKTSAASALFATDASPNKTLGGTILGVVDCTNGQRCAVMQISENQAVIHELAPGQTPPEIGKRATLTVDAKELSTAQSRDNDQSQKHGVKR